MARKKTTVSLVLGSGGARGLAHIGIIHWLEDNGYVVEAVSGCSMGALVGGIFAIGKLDEYEEWSRAITKSNMLALLDLSMGTDGLFKGSRIIETLKGLVGEARIEDLEVDYTAVAANISQGKEVWFDEGPIFDAIRASISLPLFFTPFSYQGQTLVDGGILNPVPIAPTFRNHTDRTIAVNLCAPPEKASPLEGKRHRNKESRFSDAVSDFVDKVKANIPSARFNLRAQEILAQSFDAMQGTIARQKIAAYPPDHVLNIPRNFCGMLDFDMAGALIEYGYEKAGQTLPHG